MNITDLTVHELKEKLAKKEITISEITKAYVDRIVEKEVPVEVEVEKPYIPTFFWIMAIYAAIITLLMAFKAYFKLKK